LDAFGSILPFPAIWGPGESPNIVALDWLLDRAAASIDSVTDTNIRAKLHRPPSERPSKALHNQELRKLAASRLVRVFVEELGQPFYEHVAAVVTFLSGIDTEADYVKKLAKRGGWRGDKTAPKNR
jgi:hypothetical protein